MSTEDRPTRRDTCFPFLQRFPDFESWPEEPRSVWVNERRNRYRVVEFRPANRGEFDVVLVLVQPGASVDRVTVPILQLLASTELFLKKTTDANFRVVLNAAGAD